MSKKLLSNIETKIRNTHQLDHGATIAQYDLVGLKDSKCLHTPNYGLIINDIHHNRHYVEKAVPKCQHHQSLQRKAQEKLSHLKQHLAKLDNKYHIFSRSEARILSERNAETKPVLNSIFDALSTDTKTNRQNVDYMSKLHKVDQLSKHVPIFFPQHKSRLTSNFGMRKHPVTKTHKFHYGADFAGKKLTSIYAAADGEVSAVERVSGYGNIVTIKHGKKFSTRYAHLSKIFAKEGQHVIRGQRIALQGKTGNAASDHLHFEILFNDKHADPMDFIATGYSCQK